MKSNPTRSKPAGNPKNFRNDESTVQRARSKRSPWRDYPACDTKRATMSFIRYKSRGNAE